MPTPMVVNIQALKQAFLDHRVIPVFAFPVGIEYPKGVDAIVQKIQPVTLPSGRKAYIFYRFPDFYAFGVYTTRIAQVILMCGCLSTKLSAESDKRVASWNIFTVPESEVLFWRWLKLEPPRDKFKLVYLYISHLPLEEVGQALATQLGSVLSVLYYIQETGDEQSWYVKKALEILQDRRFSFPIRLRKLAFVLEPVFEISQRIPRFPDDIISQVTVVLNEKENKPNYLWNTIPKIQLYLVSKLSDSVLSRFYEYLAAKDLEGGLTADESESE